MVNARHLAPLFLLFPLLLLGCGPEPSRAQAPSASFYGEPDSLLFAGGQTVPVYGSFEQIEPLFQQANDTTYVINFWATWCKPCVEEMPYFERLQHTFAGEKVKVVLVSLDFEKAIPTKLLPFLERKGLRSAVMVLLDGNYNQWVGKVSEEWKGAIPVTLVYNASGRKVHNNQFASYEELETMVRELL